MAAQTVGELLDAEVQVQEVRFHVLSSLGEADATWHVDMTIPNRSETAHVEARLEPFTGKVIGVERLSEK